MSRPLPRTLEQALDPAWLTEALAPVSKGARVTEVETVELLKTVATKVRFKARYENGETGNYCLKAFLDLPPDAPATNPTSVREADFYNKIANKITVRVPTCVNAPVADGFGVVIMRDLIVDGARFCTALEPFDANRAAASLEQLARLHMSHKVLEASDKDWLPRQLHWLAQATYTGPAALQELMDGPRGEGLPARSRNAEVLIAGLKALAALDETRPAVLIHGDCHAGNIFETKDGAGLIDWQLLQQGGWALDVVYHISAALPIELAEKEERNLLNHYLDCVRRLGGEVPDAETAWRRYRESAVYGYYLWAITRKVDPPIIVAFNQRLGSAVTRHESYKLLGV
jgi:hypothetical protein